jgi:glycosyltransferase involved in cell wall biosynthesis
VDRPPSVSVIIPVYNCERYLAEATDSVLSQTHAPLEVLVVDDGSEDGSASVAQRFGPPVRYVYQPHIEPGGAAHARNRGVELAQGDLLAFLDADDLWVPDKLERQLAALAAPSRPDAIFVEARQFISPELSGEARRQISCPSESIPAYVPSSMLIARETFLRVGSFDSSWRMGEPLDRYLRATEKGLTSIVLPDVLMLRRLHATNLGVLQRAARSDYPRILKASLDRRRGRAASGAGVQDDGAR